MKLLIESHTPGVRQTRLTLDFPNLECWSEPNPHILGSLGDQQICINNLEKAFSDWAKEPMTITIIPNTEALPSKLTWKERLTGYSHRLSSLPLQ